MGERTAEVFGRRKNGAEFPAGAAISKLQVGGKTILTVALRDITEKGASRTSRGSLRRRERSWPPAWTTSRPSRGWRSSRCATSPISASSTSWTRRASFGGSSVTSRDRSKESVCEALMHLPAHREYAPFFASVLRTDAPVLVSEVLPEAVASWAESEPHRRALLSIAPKSIIAVPLRAHGKPVGLVALISTTRGYRPADLRMAEELAQRAALSIEKARLYREAQSASRSGTTSWGSWRMTSAIPSARS